MAIRLVAPKQLRTLKLLGAELLTQGLIVLQSFKTGVWMYLTHQIPSISAYSIYLSLEAVFHTYVRTFTLFPFFLGTFPFLSLFLIIVRFGLFFSEFFNWKSVAH